MRQERADSRRGVRPVGRRPAILLATIALLALAIPAIADAKKKGKRGPTVTVMGRNLFLGANLRPLTRASSVSEAIDLAGVTYGELLETKFSERVVPLAKEIKKSKAHLVGLQEVAQWRQQTPSDYGAPPLGPGEPATTVREDFLVKLRQELKRIGAKYKLVDVQEELDAELPVDVDGSNATGEPLFGAEFDLGLTLRNAILAKKGSKVKVGKTNSATFNTLYEPSIGGPVLTVERGWHSVEAKIQRKGEGKKKRASISEKGGSNKFRFVHTHLEAYDTPPTIRPVQAQELVAGPLDTKKQVILVGDINSGLAGRHNVSGPPVTDHPDDRLAFEVLDDFGMKDNGAVQTCCSNVLNPTRVLTHTVDHVLTKPGLKTKKAFTTGSDPEERTPSGLWPADHDGLVSKLKLKK